MPGDAPNLTARDDLIGPAAVTVDPERYEALRQHLLDQSTSEHPVTDVSWVDASRDALLERLREYQSVARILLEMPVPEGWEAEHLALRKLWLCTHVDADSEDELAALADLPQLDP